jgi:hypothetical protein
VQAATSALVLGDLVAQEDLGLTLLSGGPPALDREVAGIDLVFKRVPSALLEEARERAFPVLAVPLGTPFRDIVGFINRSLLSGCGPGSAGRSTRSATSRARSATRSSRSSGFRRASSPTRTSTSPRCCSARSRRSTSARGSRSCRRR